MACRSRSIERLRRDIGNSLVFQAILLTVDPEASAASAAETCCSALGCAAATGCAAAFVEAAAATFCCWDCHAAIAALPPAPPTLIPMSYSL